MKTSARNQFLGKIKTIKTGPVNAEVILDIGGGHELVASITTDSANHLGLAEGKEVYALVKASWVILSTDTTLKTSARNLLEGTVTRCQDGVVNAEVVIELSCGKTLAAIVTEDSVHSLGLKEGVKVGALIKASHVILAVPT